MTGKEPRADVAYALLCDDIRKELSGKDILVGVYTGSLLVQNFPAKITLCLWLDLKIAGKGEVKTEIRVLNPAGEQITGGELTVNVADEGEGNGSVALRGMPLNLEKEGQYKIQWRKPKARWSTILTKQVALQQQLSK